MGVIGLLLRSTGKAPVVDLLNSSAAVVFGVRQGMHWGNSAPLWPKRVVICDVSVFPAEFVCSARHRKAQVFNEILL